MKIICGAFFPREKLTMKQAATVNTFYLQGYVIEACKAIFLMIWFVYVSFTSDTSLVNSIGIERASRSALDEFNHCYFYPRMRLAVYIFREIIVDFNSDK